MDWTEVLGAVISGVISVAILIALGVLVCLGWSDSLFVGAVSTVVCGALSLIVVDNWFH